MNQPEKTMEKLVSALTLSQKARRLVVGFDAVKEAILNQTAKLVLLSDDVSPKTRKEAEYLCQTHHVMLRILPFKMDELWYLLGRKAGVLSVIDKGFAEKILALLEICLREERIGHNI